MTVQAMPWAIQGQSHPAENARNLVAAMFNAPVAALVEGVSITTAGGAHGIVGAGDLVVSQKSGGANMSVDVAAGRAIIRSTEAASLAAGAYSFLNDAVVNLVVAAADPTNPRIDIVIAQVRDSNYSGASTDARLTVVTGTPAASPAVPAVPDSCVVLAQVAVAAAVGSITNAVITDKRTRAYSLGGIAVCTAATRPSGVSLYEGLVIVELDTDRMWIYSGAAWVFLSYYSVAGRPGVILTDAAQTITTATATDITWGTEVSDVDGWTAGGIATLTVPTGWDGRVAVSYSGIWSGATGVQSSIACLVNGTAAYDASAGTGLYFAPALTFVRSFAAGDTMKFQVYYSSAGPLTITSRLEVVWLGR